MIPFADWFPFGKSYFIASMIFNCNTLVGKATNANSALNPNPQPLHLLQSIVFESGC